jgi:peroxiredoxin
MLGSAAEWSARLTPALRKGAMLKVGDKAPTFRLPAHDGSVVSLADFAGKWIVLYFYPKALTPG